MKKVSYPSKIITSLSNMSLVEDEMIPGGFFSTIRQTKDWFNIGLSISKLLDLHEEHLIETIREVIQSDLKLIERHRSNENDHDQFSSPSHLKPLSANIISQPLLPAALRNTLKAKLLIQEVSIVLEVMKEWMAWWIPIEIEDDVEKIEDERRKLSSPEKKVKKG
ncbi:hypothetical protein DFH28DRAFT_947260 [Melampsora americana]|nr:hypothetical protein DFH28DRAFT_947260 [Melampsora americana]